jgi:hypothetical protein
VLLAATLPSAAAPGRSHSVNRSVRLKANGEPFVRVSAGDVVTLAATLHPLFAAKDKSWHGDWLLIRERRPGSSTSETVQQCGGKTIVLGEPCDERVSSRVAGKYYVQAFLVHDYLPPPDDLQAWNVHHKVIAKSAVVTVTFVEASDFLSISDETATTGIFISGPKQGQKTCVDPSPSLYGQYCADDQNVGTTLTLTARINGPLPSGDEMWITYDAPNASDPTVKRCDPTITSNCVLARTKTLDSLETTVTLPPDKSFGGGAHGAEAGAEIVNSRGYAAAGLSIQLCQDGANPRCG